MNTLERKKFNLLIHLAKVDGKFHKSERELLQSFLKEKGLAESTLDEEEHPINFSELAGAPRKAELLYWAIRLVKADQIIHEKELAFCKNLAEKLNFKKEAIDYYLNNPLPEFSVFEKSVEKFIL